MSSSFPLLIRFYCSLFFLLTTRVVDATVYTHNATADDLDRIASYPSLPALFGAQFEDRRIYSARLQYLVENPFLCDEIDFDRTTFVGKFIEPTTTTSNSAHEGTTAEEEESHFSYVDAAVDDPIVMLAARGSCPFHHKAMIAESLGLRVQYLIIYNHNYDGEDVLVPMYSEYGNSRLKILSVTHRTGTALKRYIANATSRQRSQGGPVLTMDGLPPEGIMTAKDLQNVLISTLGLFFMLVSCSGCFLMCAAAAQHNRRIRAAGDPTGAAGNNSHRMSPLWLILMGDPDTDPVMVGDPATAARAFGVRSVLTTEEVERYLLQRSSSLGEQSSDSEVEEEERKRGNTTATTTVSSSKSNTGETETQINSDQSCCSSSPPSSSANPLHCAICIDDIDEASPTESIVELPCHHKFHQDCIIPWLTERQSKCPLCKYDVFMYVQERAAQDPARNSSSIVSPRLRRRLPRFFLGGGGGASWFFPQQSLWMAVNHQEHDDDDDDGEEEGGTTHSVELEMAEAQSSSASNTAETSTGSSSQPSSI